MPNLCNTKRKKRKEKRNTLKTFPPRFQAKSKQPEPGTWASQVGSLAATVSTQERKRQEGLYEIIQTEETYLKKLAVTLNVYFAFLIYLVFSFFFQ